MEDCREMVVLPISIFSHSMHLEHPLPSFCFRLGKGVQSIPLVALHVMIESYSEEV